MQTECKIYGRRGKDLLGSVARERGVEVIYHAGNNVMGRSGPGKLHNMAQEARAAVLCAIEMTYWELADV